MDSLWEYINLINLEKQGFFYYKKYFKEFCKKCWYFVPKWYNNAFRRIKKKIELEDKTINKESIKNIKLGVYQIR